MFPVTTSSAQTNLDRRREEEESSGPESWPAGKCLLFALFGSLALYAALWAVFDGALWALELFRGSP
jgi:hypothetical protein